MGQSPGACGGSLPALLAGYVMRAGGESQGVRTGPDFLGTNLCVPGRRIVPPRPRPQHSCGVPTNILFVIQFSAVCNEVINWLQFSYTGDTIEGYTDTAYTNLSGSTLTEGDPLFAPALLRLKTPYPGEYTRVSTYTLVPNDPD